jgi:hypothetical protein
MQTSEEKVKEIMTKMLKAQEVGSARYAHLWRGLPLERVKKNH